MNVSAPFIARPVATTLLTIGVALAGAVAFFLLPVAPLPDVDIPTITVQASLPGASPETVATSVATPLERHLGQIADVTEMTSTSSVGSARIVLQFGLDRDIDGAARDVQGAIVAARVDLPTSLRSNPTYRKINPADAPILILAMTSNTLTTGQLYDSAATVLQQKLSQVEGVGQVSISGSSLPAVRVDLNPKALFKYGIGLEDVRAALAAANADSPKGAIEEAERHFQIYDNDQARRAETYRPLIVAYRHGLPVRLADLGAVTDSVEDLRNQGLSNGVPSVVLSISRQPNANIIDAVDAVKAVLPQLQASIPRDIDMHVVYDRTTTIRSSLKDTERTLAIAVMLVIIVVYGFLRSWRATVIPAVAVPISLIATFGAMYLLHYTLDVLSLMALTVATGFVVDDAIVVLENVTRHLEAGTPRIRAAMLGAREVGFTVLSMSASLIAVFIPILLMGGIPGRLFREFGMTISIAIGVSLIVSLTTTPMMCAVVLRRGQTANPGRAKRWIAAAFEALQRVYLRSLHAALEHAPLVAALLVVTIGLNFYLYSIIPFGFFPQQDTGQLMGGVRGDQSISFQLMRQKIEQFAHILQSDPAIQQVQITTGGGGGFGGGTNSAMGFIQLKPLAERHATADQVIARLRPKLARVAGATMFLQSVQDVHAGGRPGNSQFQYTLEGDDLAALRQWAPKLAAALHDVPEVADVDSDQQEHGLETDVVIDRQTAGRLGLTAAQIDNALYDAFGQRQVSTIYNALNQYHVVMDVAPQYWQSPETLKDVFVSTSGAAVNGTASTNAIAGTFAAKASAPPSAATIANDEARNYALNGLANSGRGGTSTGAAVSTQAEKMIPLGAVAHFAPGATALAINHQGNFVATTISFNLPVGKSLGDAVAAIDATMRRIRMPASIHGGFQGTAAQFTRSLATEPLLILTALVTVYIVLGVLYESYIHPITILSTLPSAGVGALLALLLCRTEFSLIALIGVILLIGIVKKNAIMMIDFAIDAERVRNLDPRTAILEACRLRFRPIMMTTMAALLGALPLALGFGDGAELRQPLGISIVGGLLVSQVLTLYTTPVVYLYFDRFGRWLRRSRSRSRAPFLNTGGATI